MKLGSHFAGTPLRGRSVTVNWRDTMNYAAAVGDNNPVYFDDERKTGIIAPPMFCVALTWPVSERLADHVESGDFPEAVLRTQVHYTEHIAIHRPIRPEERLFIRGKIAAILPHPSGTHAVVRFDASDASGAAVFTEHIGGLMRGVHCDGEPAGRTDLPEIERHESKPGQMDWSCRIFIDPLLPYIYDGCTNIFFPIHTSVRFARSVGLPGIILQGTATLALAVREITNAFAGGDPARIRVIACRFTHMVTPGSRITVEARRPSATGTPDRIRFAVRNEQGKKAISDGYVVF